MLDGVRHGLADDLVHEGLLRGVERLGRLEVEREADAVRLAQPLGQRQERGRDALLAQRRRLEAPAQLAEVAHRLAVALAGDAEDPVHLAGVVVVERGRAILPASFA